jgi:hypothetical protein
VSAARPLSRATWKPPLVVRCVVLVVAAVLAVLTVGCQGSGGVGLGYSYPGRFYGPVDSGRFGGGGPL